MHLLACFRACEPARATRFPSAPAAALRPASGVERHKVEKLCESKRVENQPVCNLYSVTLASSIKSCENQVAFQDKGGFKRVFFGLLPPPPHTHLGDGGLAQRHEVLHGALLQDVVPGATSLPVNASQQGLLSPLTHWFFGSTVEPQTRLFYLSPPMADRIHHVYSNVKP